MNRPELLAPVGGESQLIAAIRFGADAVYMGGKRFGLRAYAGNFDDDALKRATDYVHSHGKKIHVTVNAYMYNNDLDGVADAVRELERIGVDAAIVADPATIEICREVAPKLTLHLSTQANTLNWRAAAFWHRQGIKRVVLARELNMEDVRGICEKTPESLEIEALVEQKNKFTAGETLQWMSPAGSVDFICKNMTDEEGQLIDCAPHPKQRVLLPLPEGAQAGDFIRRRIPEKV